MLFNYSSNPSYIDTNGNLNNTTMADSPLTYVTTVGLYNEDNELLVVGKLGQPIRMSDETDTTFIVCFDE